MTAEGREDYVKASFIDVESHGGLSFYEFETHHRDSIVVYYYIAFAVFEVLPLVVLSSCFVKHEDDLQMRAFKLSRFCFYCAIPVFAAVDWQQANAAWTRLVRDYRTRTEIWLYAAATLVSSWSLLLAVQCHSPANALLAVRGKFFCSICLRVAKRFPLKGKEVRFLIMFSSFILCLCLCQEGGFWTFGVAAAGGTAFFLSEGVFSTGVTLDESEILNSGVHLLLSLLYLSKAVSGKASSRASVEVEGVWAVLVSLVVFLRFWVLKRCKYVQNDNSAEAYNELHIVFVGFVASLLGALIPSWPNWGLETLVALIGFLAFLTFRQKELRSLYTHFQTRGAAASKRAHQSSSTG